LDYEVSPSPSATTQQGPTNAVPHHTSTDTVRHIGLNIGDSLTDETETPPATPASARSQTKYASTRELPKNWSDDESTSVTEAESVKSGTCVCA
jgi:hypothetical protein